jgi:cell wall-associated NlpC family hydrolase
MLMFRRTIALLACPVTMAACAPTGAVPRPFPMPDRAAPGNASPAAPATTAPGPYDGYALTTTALALRGAPYRSGGADPRGFDCSGFTRYVFGQYGVPLPRGVEDQFRMGASVNPAEIAPGDLLFFATTDRAASHVGIAVGADEFVHAPNSRGVVRVDRLSQPYWSQRFLGARRLR